MRTRATYRCGACGFYTNDYYGYKDHSCKPRNEVAVSVEEDMYVGDLVKIKKERDNVN